MYLDTPDWFQMDYNCNDAMMETERNIIKQRLRINVGGDVFVTFATTLQNIPGTKLSNLTPDCPHYDVDNNEYFFDRNPVLFPFILDAYRTGHLHFPHNVCAPVFKQELDYWGLQEARIATCCWKTYLEYEHDKQALNKLEDAIQCHRRLADTYREKTRSSRIGRLRMAIWAFLEDPSSSTPAMVCWNISNSLKIFSYFYNTTSQNLDFLEVYIKKEP